MSKVIIVSEIGCNHKGDLSIAKEMIYEAKRCGCDYVKFQKRDLNSVPEALAKKPYNNAHSFGDTYLAHREALEFNNEQWLQLKATAKNAGIGIFGTAFDIVSARFLCAIDMPYLKIGSMQCRDTNFLSAIANMKNVPPVILSTGMCTAKDVEIAVWALKGNTEILVHATSSYPCPETEVNLKVLSSYKGKYKIGLSGHYASGNGAIESAAVALGATYIERHFTLDRTWKGTDQAASLEPSGMEHVVKAIRSVERALGDGKKRVMPSEIPIIEKLMCR